MNAWYTRVFAVVMASLLAPEGASGQEDPDSAAWQRARQVGTYEAYQRYLEEFPAGRYADEAFRSMIEEALDQEFGPDSEGTLGLY